MRSLSLREIAAQLKIPAPDANPAITGVATLTDATPTEISFLATDAFLKEFARTKAAAVLVQNRVKIPANARTPVLLVEHADLAVAQVLKLFAPPVPHPPV